MLKKLSLNKMMAKNVEIVKDQKEIQEMRDELYTMLENDQIC